MIENTSDRDPLLHLLGAMGGNDRYVTDMEAAGQRQLVNSDRLPVKVNGGTDEEFAAVGFTFGEADPRDPLFRPAVLPEGWKREASSHDMWSYVVDANGRRRVAIFYKAAFYDRDAFMRLETIHSEVFRLLYGETTLVVDEWTTREEWTAALTEARDRFVKEAETDEQYDYAAGAKRAREQAAKCERLLAELAAAR